MQSFFECTWGCHAEALEAWCRGPLRATLRVPQCDSLRFEKLVIIKPVRHAEF